MQHIQVKRKLLQYYTAFQKPDVTKEIWFIIHGGAMLIVYAPRNENEIDANYFICDLAQSPSVSNTIFIL